MRKLLAKLALLAFLISPIFGLPLAVLWLSGELTPVDEVVREQMTGSRRVYFACAYSDPRMLLKLRFAQARLPEVLIMGTSRVGQIRSEFFLPGVKFYNASMATETLSDYRVFLEHLPSDKLPKLVIAGLDQRYFNPNDQPMGSFDINVKQASSPWRVPVILARQWRKIYADYWDGKFRLGQIWRRENAGEKLIGLRAVAVGDGFRNDGSFYYRLNVIKKRRDIEEGLLRIDQGGHFFDPGGEVSSESLAELERFAGFCRQRDIHLIAFLPPYAHAAYERLKANGNYGYVFELPHLVRPIIERNGFAFHDFSDLAELGIPDSQSFDVYHPTETATLRYFLRLVESDVVLQHYCDVSLLKNVLASSNNEFCVFEN